MSGAEQAVRACVANMLRGNMAVMAAVNGVYDTAVPRMTPPYIRVDVAEGRDWGTKDRAGREVMLTVNLLAGKHAAAGTVAAMEAALADVGGGADGWQIVASRILRSRWSEKADGSWQQHFLLRCRCFIGLS